MMQSRRIQQCWWKEEKRKEERKGGIGGGRKERWQKSNSKIMPNQMPEIQETVTSFSSWGVCMHLYIKFVQMSLFIFSVASLTKSGQPHQFNPLQKNKQMSSFSDRGDMVWKTAVLVKPHNAVFSTKWSFSNNLLVCLVILLTKKWWQIVQLILIKSKATKEICYCKEFKHPLKLLISKNL